MKLFSLLCVLVSTVYTSTTPPKVTCDMLDKKYIDMCKSMGDGAKPILEERAMCANIYTKDELIKECYTIAFELQVLSFRSPKLSSCEGKDDVSRLRSCSGIKIGRDTKIAACVRECEGENNVLCWNNCVKKTLEGTNDSDKIQKVNDLISGKETTKSKDESSTEEVKASEENSKKEKDGINNKEHKDKNVDSKDNGTKALTSSSYSLITSLTLSFVVTLGGVLSN